MVVNGCVILLVFSNRQLRIRKTNALVVSLAVADFGVEMIVAPSLIFCNLATERTLRLTEAGLIVISERLYIFYASGTNFFSLVQERYVAVVKPLKYFTFMKRRRVIQML